MSFQQILEVLIWSSLLSFLMALLYRILIKPEEMRKVKNEIGFYRQKTKEAQKSGDKAKADEALAEMLKANQKNFRLTMKPLIVTGIIFFVALGFLRQTYSNFTIQLPFTMPLISLSYPPFVLRDSIGWFWWYVFITIPMTTFFRKMLGVE